MMQRKQGFTLINSLIALLVFTFGMLALAGAYVKVNANQSSNEYFTNAGVLAESLRSMLSASPALLPQMNTFSSNDVQTSQSLINWMAQLRSILPPGVVATTASYPAGTACTANASCTLKLTISWANKNGLSSEQSFVIQIGY